MISTYDMDIRPALERAIEKKLLREARMVELFKAPHKWNGADMLLALRRDPEDGTLVAFNYELGSDSFTGELEIKLALKLTDHHKIALPEELRREMEILVVVEGIEEKTFTEFIAYETIGTTIINLDTMISDPCAISIRPVRVSP